MKNRLVLLFLFKLFSLHAQVGIGTTSPNSSSILELHSENKGLLIPRVNLNSTADSTTLPSPAVSLLIYNLAEINDVIPGFYYWDGVWKPLRTTILPSVGTNWSLGGNTISSADFLGSVNFFPLRIKVNNNQFGKFHPNGGITLGYGALANDNNAIAIGTNANAAADNQATAISPSSTASGYQSTALGYGSMSSNNSAMALGYQATATGYQSTALGYSSLSSNNSTMALGSQSSASGHQSTAVGTRAIASGQNATAIGFQASVNQSDAIVLGDSSNSNNKIGIGTNSPDERLHIVGSLKLVDGNQNNGYVLTSDSNGKATWKDLSSQNHYGNIYYNNVGQSLDQYTNIVFGGTNSNNGLTVHTDGISVNKTGVYKITYNVSITKLTTGVTTISYNLYKNYSSIIPGALSFTSIGNNETRSISASVIIPLNAYDKVSIRSNISDSNIVYQSNGTSLCVEIMN